MHAYVIENYKHLINIAYLVKYLKAPLPRLMKQIPTVRRLKESWYTDTDIPEKYLSTDKKIILYNLKEILGPYWKMFVERKSTFDQNISK